MKTLKAALFSLGLHGAVAAFFIPSFSKVESEKALAFNIVWRNASSLCHPAADENPGKSLSQKNPLAVKKVLAASKKVQVTSARLLDAHLHEDGRKDNKTANTLSSSPGPATTPRHNSKILLHQPLPSYPWICRKRHQEGIVCLHVKTNREGHVVAVSLHKSSGHSLLDETALETVKSWIFEERNIQKTIFIAFRLKGNEVSVS